MSEQTFNTDAQEAAYWRNRTDEAERVELRVQLKCARLKDALIGIQELSDPNAWHKDNHKDDRDRLVRIRHLADVALNF